MRFAASLAFLALALPARSTAQISPGPLSRAHQSLEGTTNCTRCHGTAKDAMPRLCLACHREITTLIAQNRGYHVRDAKTSGKSCAACHPDHAGRDFNLVAWPAGGRERFDHRTSGWSLEGKHAPLACDRCHRQEFRTGQAATLSPRKTTTGWVGLETNCASCHQRADPHKNSLGPSCEKCHDAAAWSPTPKFDHAASRYPLTGKHVDVACAKCHLAAALGIAPQADGKRVPRFKPLQFAECSACHADPHQGRLSGKCSDCHVTRGFDVRDRRDFNHALTRYLLLGKHRTVACEGCHGRDMAKPRPAFATCATCHADRHAGEATLAGAVVDCAACHRVEGFVPSTFTLAQHRAVRFPLGSKHESVPCAKCHTSTRTTAAAKTTIHIRVAFTTCATCHADPHGNQLAGRACDQCHTDQGWSDSRYDIADHARTRLPLEGRHATLGCASCHGPKRPGLPGLPQTATLGRAGVLFHIPEVACATCHADPHTVAGQARRDASTGCADCHTAVAFKPAAISVESHARFSFRLEGAHRAVPCRDCHTALPPPGPAAGRGATLIAALPSLSRVPLGVPRGKSCSGCHRNPHGMQFVARADSGRCESCHSTDTFIGAPRFDHDRDAAFSIKGAHAAVSCAKCHRTETVAGISRVVYRPLPHRCEDCHTVKPGGGR